MVGGPVSGCRTRGARTSRPLLSFILPHSPALPQAQIFQIPHFSPRGAAGSRTPGRRSPRRQASGGAASCRAPFRVPGPGVPRLNAPATRGNAFSSERPRRRPPVGKRGKRKKILRQILDTPPPLPPQSPHGKQSFFGGPGSVRAVPKEFAGIMPDECHACGRDKARPSPFLQLQRPRVPSGMAVFCRYRQKFCRLPLDRGKRPR